MSARSPLMSSRRSRAKENVDISSPLCSPASPSPFSRYPLPVGAPDIDLLREHLHNQGALSTSAIHLLLSHFSRMIHQEPTVLRLSQPFHIIGDLHGQFYDLLHILDETSQHQIGGDNRYLFLGDYVDRGPFSVEVCLYLFALKLKHPHDVFLLRGNHECQLLTKHFSFQKECVQKYGKEIFEKFVECFRRLPLAAVVDTAMGQFFCVHGGLSPSTPTVSSILSLEREKEIPAEGALCDLLWSDPLGEDTAVDLTDADWEEWWGVEYERNPSRGCGYVFGYKAIKDFLDENGFVCLVRGHEVQRDGCAEHYFFKEEERKKEWEELWKGGEGEEENGQKSEEEESKESEEPQKEAKPKSPLPVHMIPQRTRRSSTFSYPGDQPPIPVLKKKLSSSSSSSSHTPLTHQDKRKILSASKAPPYMFTIFSCPNYCDMYGNKAGALTLLDTEYSLRTFSSMPHPYVLPTLDNALSYTFPYVMENVLQFFLNAMKYLVKTTLDVREEEEEEEEEEEGEEGKGKGKEEGAVGGGEGAPRRGRRERRSSTLERSVENLSLYLKLSEAVVADNQQQVKEQNTVNQITDPYVRFDRMRVANMRNESLPGSTAYKSLNRCISSHL